MADLTAKRRKALPGKDFAGPGRSYPIEDKGHAKAALSLSSRYGSPATKAAVRGAVKAKYPGMGKKK